MLNQKRTINVGDRVVLYASREKMSLVTVKSGEIYNSKFGNFKHNNLIGAEYGSKIISEDKSGFMYCIALNPELWSVTLDHRTQILFNLDISTIIYNLEIKNGSKVVESGTGSGSLSTSIARTIAPKGHLYTFEFHKDRSEHAIKDFKENGISEYITVTHADACRDGFALHNIPNMVGHIDAVFLDLPSPWEAIDNAVQVIHHGSMLCSFSPCIEQVQNTCLKLGESSFQEIKTIEVLIRTYETKYHGVEDFNLVNPYGYNNNSNNTLNNNNNNNNNNIDNIDNKDNKKEGGGKKNKKVWSNGNTVPFTMDGINGVRKDSLLTNVIKESRGHTGYLTFARYIKDDI